MESFIHITNDTGNIGPTDVSSISATPSHLPESPPDSGSEPPYSPVDLHVLALCNTPVNGNRSQISDIHHQHSNGFLSNSAETTTTTTTTSAPTPITTAHGKATARETPSNDQQSATDGVPSRNDIASTNENINAETTLQSDPHHILRNTNVLYIRSTDSDRNATLQPQPTTNSRPNTNTQKSNELLLKTGNGVTSASQLILQQVCL